MARLLEIKLCHTSTHGHSHMMQQSCGSALAHPSFHALWCLLRCLLNRSPRQQRLFVSSLPPQ